MCLAAHELSFRMDSLKCQTAAASPAEPGELPLRLGKAILLLAGARGATGFVEICVLLGFAARLDRRAGTRGAIGFRTI